jgi:hypothetical protein
MKKALIVLISIIILINCKTAPEEVDEYKSIKEILAEYDISVLAKIEQNALPRFTAIFEADFNELGDYSDDLGKLLFKQLENSGRLDIREEKKTNELITEHKLFPEHNSDDLLKLAYLANADFILKAYIASSKMEYIEEEDKVQTNINLILEIVNGTDGSLFQSLKSSATMDSSGTSAIEKGDAELYKTAQTGIRDLVNQIRDIFPAFGFVLRVDGTSYTTDLGKNVLAEKGQTIAFISQGAFDPENPEEYIYEFYSAGVISEINDISSIVIVDEDNRPPGNAIAVLINNKFVYKSQ